MEILIIIVLVFIWNTSLGKFIIGNIAKMIYSGIAISICMAIPIPIVNVLLALYFVSAIWSSEIG